MVARGDQYAPALRNVSKDAATWSDLPDWPFIVLDPGEAGLAGLFPAPSSWRSRWQMPIEWTPILGLDGVAFLRQMRDRIDELWPVANGQDTARCLLLVEHNMLAGPKMAGASLTQSRSAGFFMGAFCSVMRPRSHIVSVYPATWHGQLGVKGKRKGRKALVRELAAPYIPASRAPETKAVMEALCDVMGIASWWVRLKGSTAVRLGAC